MENTWKNIGEHRGKKHGNLGEDGGTLGKIMELWWFNIGLFSCLDREMPVEDN